MGILALIKRLLLAALLLAPAGAFAAWHSVAQNFVPAGGPGMMATPILSLASGSSNFPSISATNYAYIVSLTATASYSGTLNSRQFVVPTAGTISNLEVYFPTTILTGTNPSTCGGVSEPGSCYQIALNKAGSASTLTCNVFTGQQGCSDSTHSVTVAIGDLITWQITPTNSPTVQAAPIQISATFTSTVGQESPLFSGNGSGGNMGTAGANQYTSFGQNVAWNATETAVSVVIPTAGTIDNLEAIVSATPSPGTYAFTVMHNGSASSLTCTISSASPCSDTTVGHAISVVAGDTISLQSLSASTPTARIGQASVRWVPATSNLALLFDTPTVVPTTSATRYMAINGSSNNNTVEANELNIAPFLGTTMTLGNLTIAQCPGPGGAVTRTVTARSGTAGGSQSSASLTATVAAGTTACPTYSTATNNTTFTATSGQVLNWMTTVSGANTALTQFKIGATVTVP